MLYAIVFANSCLTQSRPTSEADGNFFFSGHKLQC